MKHISQDNLNKITELRHLLHRYPDLSLNESGTIDILKGFLKENTGLEIVDKKGWFYLVLYGKKIFRRTGDSFTDCFPCGNGCAAYG